MKIPSIPPVIAVFGPEAAANALANDIHEALPDSTVPMAVCTQADDVLNMANNCLMVFMLTTHSADDSVDLMNRLSLQPDFVADLIAITDHTDLHKRLHVMGLGFDNTFNPAMIRTQDFANVLRHKLRKAQLRLERRVLQDAFIKFKATLSASPDAYIVFDEHKRIVFASAHYLNVYPKSAHKLVPGVHVTEAFDLVAEETGIHKGDPGYDIIRDFWYALEPGQTEFPLWGGIKYLRVSCVALPDGQGAIVSTTDITDYKQQEKALAEALAKEQEASNLQKQFISMVSHEFRTPLAIIDGNAQLLAMRADQPDPANIKTRTRTIQSAVARLVNMMESVLSSNLLKTGRLDPVWDACDIRRLIRDLAVEQADLAPSHSLTLDIDALPETIITDNKLLIIVLSNLISNAVKYTPDDPRIQIIGTVSGDRLSIAVQDNGVGIPTDQVELVFDRFFRASSAGTIGGTGVGLSLVRDLTRLLGGHVHLQSVLGQGSIFTVTLPIDPPHG